MADYQGQYTGPQVDAAIGKAHEHSNKELLDTYSQTEANLADAVSKKHQHSNISVLSGITSTLVTAWDAASTWVTTNGANVLSHIADTTIHVTSQLVSTWNAKYDKPSGGIPKTDLASGVQTSLGKADTALQSHQSLAAYRKSADQDVIDAGKQATISDLSTIRSGAALGATALQSVPNTYRTAAEQDAIHDSTKQDVISDLSTIRSGAALGATSLQPVSGTHTNEIVTLDSGGNLQSSGKTVADMQEKLIAGDNITIGADGKTISASGGGTSFDIHSLTTEDALADGDEMPLYDVSASESRKTTWSNIVSKVSTALSSVFAAVSHTHTKSQITDFPDIPAAQIQSDWSQSDTTAKDYIKNKPTIPDELSDLQDDATHRTVTDTEKATWNGKGTYSKPADGIPDTDLTSAVQASLDKADAAIPEPTSEGTSGQVLTTDGNGGRSWTTPQGGGGGATEEQEEIIGSAINDLHETQLDWLNGRTLKGKMLFESNVVNNLTSLLPNVPLSAYQGRILNCKFSEIELIVASALVDLAKSATIMQNIADPYSGTRTYSVGAYCTQDGHLWKCDTAVSTHELFDVSKWHTTSVMSEILSLINA